MTSVSQKLFSSVGQSHEFELAMIKQGVSVADIQAGIDGRKNIYFVESKEKDLPADLGLKDKKMTKEELLGLNHWEFKALCKPFFQEVYGLQVDFSDELMPEAPDEFSWSICVPWFMSKEAIFSSGNLDMFRWKFTKKPLDSVMQLDRGRDALTQNRIVRVRPNFEADDDLKNLSGNDIDNKKINVLTLPERLILGQIVYWSTGIHLDRKTVTLTGSRDSDGHVLSVDFDPNAGRVLVGWYRPDDALDGLRFRQAVSLSL